VSGRAGLWLDHKGRLSPLKLAGLVFLLVPASQLAFGLLTHSLGPRPLVELNHETGDWTLRLLILTLAITPLRLSLGWPRLILLRRLFGVATALYAVTHMLLFIADEAWRPILVLGEMVKRPYLTLGVAALLLMLPLALTSTDDMVRRLGAARWRRLHRLVYPIAVLAIAHDILQIRLLTVEPVFLAGCLIWLLGWRWRFRMLPRGVVPGPRDLLVLALSAALATAALEALLAGLGTGIDWRLVLLANLYPEIGLRPAPLVLLAGLGVALAALLRTSFVPPRSATLRRPAADGIG
jgi:sulfoxide reductase heme-binding subunit YedZ